MNKRVPRVSLAFVVWLSAALMAVFFALLTGTRSAQLLVVLTVGLMVASLDVRSLKRVLLTVIVIEVPIQLDAYLGFDPAVAANNTTSGFNVSLTTACLVVLYLLWATEAVALRGGRAAPLSRQALATLVYLAVVAVSTTFAINPVFAWYEVILLLQAVLIFFYLIHALRTLQEAQYVLDVLLVGVVFQALLVVWLSAGGSAAILKPLLSGNDIGNRVAGTIGHPNSLGAYLTFLIPMSLATLAVSRGRRRLLAGAAFTLAIVALLLTGSRGAWVGTTVALGLLAAMGLRYRWISPRLASAIAAGLVLLMGVAGQDILARVDGFSNSTALARLPLNQLALSVIQDQPILGVGANNFAQSMQTYLTVDYSQAWIATVHNKYLLVWAETGAIGLAAFLWFLVSTLRVGWRAATSEETVVGPIVAGLTLGVLGAMIHMMVDIYHSRVHLQMLWMLAALIVVLSKYCVTWEPRGSSDVTVRVAQ